MAKNRDDVKLTCTPEVLVLNNGRIDADITVTFPEKYFNKKAVVKVTPVMVFEGGEVAGTTQYLQGSKVDDNYTVIDKTNGGRYTQHVSFPYDDRMRQSELQLRAEIKCPGGKCKEFTLVNLNNGAVPTKEGGCRAGCRRCRGRRLEARIRSYDRRGCQHHAEGYRLCRGNAPYGFGL